MHLVSKTHQTWAWRRRRPSTGCTGGSAQKLDWPDVKFLLLDRPSAHQRAVDSQLICDRRRSNSGIFNLVKWLRLEMQPGAKLRRISGHYFAATRLHQRCRLQILCRTRSNAGRTSAGSLSGRIESIWKTPSKERGEAHGIGACLESGRNAERACPSSLFKFPGRTWTSGSARGKHVIKLVQVPCPTRQPAVVQVPCQVRRANLSAGARQVGRKGSL